MPHSDAEGPRFQLTPETWSQVRELLAAALERSPEDRATFLDHACGNATTLRLEVESLLNAHMQSDGFLHAISARAAVQLFAGLEWPVHERNLGPYRVLHEIGRGGMGVVYLAHDTHLDRRVALKVLPPYLSDDAAARRRLLEEARTLGALDHPNIAVIHQIGETDARQLFIAMAHYEGDTLQRRIERGRLPLADVLHLALQVGEGLAAAHARGIVHRDIKPSNIVITDHGVPKIVDFGIAIGLDGALEHARVTAGTAAYMSPEQAHKTFPDAKGVTSEASFRACVRRCLAPRSGAKETGGSEAEPSRRYGSRRFEAKLHCRPVDHRTDIWSLGVVIYEALTGTRPFKGDRTPAVLASIIHEAPPSVRSLRPDVPAVLARVIDRCLQKDPNQRFQSAQHVVAALRHVQDEIAHGGTRRARAVRLSVALAVAMVLTLMSTNAVDVLHFIRGRPPAAGSMSSVRHRLAVLPLVNLTGDSRDAHVAETMTGEIAARLSRLEGLEVIGRESVRIGVNGNSDARDIARVVGAESVLTGTVRHDEGQLEVSLQLIEASTGGTLWSRDYRAPARDVELVHRSIGENLAEVLHLPVPAPERASVGAAGTGVAVAYAAYLKGRYFGAQRDKDALDRARQSFEEAIDRDPTFARAWAGLAAVYALLGSHSWMSPVEAHGRARRAAEEALNLDEGVAEAHAVLGSVLADYYWDRDAAESHFRRAVELDPGNATAHQWLSEHLWSVGRFADAIAEATRARDLDPLSLPAQLAVGHALYMARRFDDARVEYQRLLVSEPGHTVIHFYLGLTSLRQDRYPDALRAFERIEAVTGYAPESMTGRGVVYARTGRRDDARRMLAALEHLASTQHVSPFYAAPIHLALGETGQVLALLTQAANERSWLVRLLKVDPAFDPLRSDPRFRALVERVGLGETRVFAWQDRQRTRQ